MITPKTQLAVLLGLPVGHSRSPAMMNAAFAAKKIDAVYLAWALEDDAVAGAIATLQQTGALGANVTVPHKERAATAANQASEIVWLLGAANCLVFTDRGAEAHNTDAPGLARALKDDVGKLPKGPVLVLGAGGAARATLWALADRGAKEVHIVNRDQQRARSLAELGKRLGLSCAVHTWSEMPRDVPLVINATSAQVKGEDFPAVKLSKSSIVYDLTYGDTPFVRAARKAKLKAFEGSGMLLNQAAVAFEHWTGKKAPLAVMRKALEAGR